MIVEIEAIKNKVGELQALKYVDEDKGQLDTYSKNFPAKWPCALVDIVDITFTNIGKDRSVTPQQRQQATYKLLIRVANVTHSNSSRTAPATQKANVNSIRNTIQAIHEKVQGFCPSPAAGELIRTGEKRLRRDDGVQEYQITYEGAVSNV